MPVSEYMNVQKDFSGAADGFCGIRNETDWPEVNKDGMVDQQRHMSSLGISLNGMEWRILRI